MSGALGRDRLVSALEELILSDSYPVGSMLPAERTLSERLGVSRTALREAMRTLVERNLISIEQGRGAIVLGADPAATASTMADAFLRHSVTARDVIVGRLMLESETARLAAGQRTDRDLEAMQNALNQLDESTSILRRVKADLAFHLAVAHSSGNIVLETMFQAISGLASEMMMRSLSDPAVTSAGLPQHQKIHNAIARGDGNEASTLMHDHISIAFEHYGQDLDRPLDIVAERELARMLSTTSVDLSRTARL
jgi:GntR family transcriptional regulator, transcriptional repressor for pyruvate dehydrogenase complex